MAGPYSPSDERNYFGFGFQSVKGTAVAPTKFAAYVDEIQFAHGQQVQAVREGGDGPYVARTVKNAYLPADRFAMAIRPDIAAAAFAALLGKDTVTGASDPYTHTITPDPDMDWLTVERNIGDDVTERHVDSVISSIELDVRKRDQGPEPRLTCDALAISPAFETSPTSDSYENFSPFARSEAAWTINSASNSNVESCRVTAAWTYDDRILSDPVTRQTLVKLRLDIDIELVLIMASATEESFYRAVHYGTTSGTVASETVYGGNLAVLFDRAADDRSFKLDLPAVDWVNAELTEPSPAGNEATRVRFTGHARKDSGSEAIEVTVENAESSAYVS